MSGDGPPPEPLPGSIPRRAQPDGGNGDDNGNENEIKCSLGAITLEVSGDDPEWVRETFREEWAARMDEAGEMGDVLRMLDRGCL